MRLFKLMALTLLVSGFYACDGLINRDNEMTATVDGNDFKALVTQGVEKSGVILVTGTSGTNSVVVAMDADISAGDYSMISGEAYVTYTNSEEAFTVTTSGTVTITKHDTKKQWVEGTFNGVIRSELDSSSTKEIADGVFASSYSEL